MRQGKNAPGFPPKPWTIERVRGTSGYRQTLDWYRAVNLQTGEHGPHRPNYDEASRDVPSVMKKYADPWGV